MDRIRRAPNGVVFQLLLCALLVAASLVTFFATPAYANYYFTQCDDGNWGSYEVSTTGYLTMGSEYVGGTHCKYWKGNSISVRVQLREQYSHDYVAMNWKYVDYKEYVNVWFSPSTGYPQCWHGQHSNGTYPDVPRECQHG